MDRRIIIILAVIVAAFIGAVWWSKAEDAKTELPPQRSQNYYGKLDSKVTLTEFVDFQCEACYAYYPYVKQLKEEYKDRVRFEVRNFPISSGHQHARMAATYAEAAARQGKFWEMHDMIFEGQKVWAGSQAPNQYFDQYAEQIGLDMARLKSDIESESVRNVINTDLADVQKLGGNGTPTFVLNGKKIENPGASYEKLSSVLDEALKEVD